MQTVPFDIAIAFEGNILKSTIIIEQTLFTSADSNLPDVHFLEVGLLQVDTNLIWESCSSGYLDVVGSLL